MITVKVNEILKSLDKKFLMRIGILYGGILFFFLVLVLPSCSRSASVKSRLSQIKGQLAAEHAKIAQALRLQKNREIFANEIRLAEVRFFTEDELPQLLTMVSDLARKYNLQVTASKPAVEKEPPISGPPPVAASVPPPPKIFYSTHEFEVGLSGGYHSLGSFLSALRKYPKIIQIRKLSIVDGKGLATEHDINLNIAVFSQAPIKP